VRKKKNGTGTKKKEKPQNPILFSREKGWALNNTKGGKKKRFRKLSGGTGWFCFGQGSPLTHHSEEPENQSLTSGSASQDYWSGVKPFPGGLKTGTGRMGSEKLIMLRLFPEDFEEKKSFDILLGAGRNIWSFMYAFPWRPEKVQDVYRRPCEAKDNRDTSCGCQNVYRERGASWARPNRGLLIRQGKACWGESLSLKIGGRSGAQKGLLKSQFPTKLSDSMRVSELW